MCLPGVSTVLWLVKGAVVQSTAPRGSFDRLDDPPIKSRLLPEP